MSLSRDLFDWLNRNGLLPDVRYAWSISDWDGRACIQRYELEYGRYLVGRLQAQFGSKMVELLADLDIGGLYGAATGVGAVVERRENLRGMRDTGQDTYGEHQQRPDHDGLNRPVPDVQRSVADREVEPPLRPDALDPGELVELVLEDGRVVQAYDRLLGVYGVDSVNKLAERSQPELL